ncbi:MAG: lysylphosphatidylglycerol synthase transmembrane domain-containing protein [bacterium]|nr:lysylphosphatidylglycerol synthase transmembrane domain-containing protein [bacterium]
MKKKLNIILLIIISGLVLYFSLKDNFLNTIHQILTMNIWYLLLAFIFLILFWVFRSYPMYSFCKKINKDFKYTSSLQLTLRTQFFNAVTPFATGGQPYQIYYLKQMGLNYASSTSVVLENFIVYQIALVLLGLIALLTNKIFHIFTKVYLLQKLIALGFIINALVIIVMFILAFGKRLNKFLIKIGINILTKLRLVKNKEEKLKKWDVAINDFHNSAKILLQDKKNFIFNIIYNFIALCCLYLIPLFIMYSMGTFNIITPGVAVVTSAYIMIIGSFVPIPGATGGLEYGFMQFYGNFITGSKLSAMMLVWRFITYYFGIIVGVIALNIKKVK